MYREFILLSGWSTAHNPGQGFYNLYTLLRPILCPENCGLGTVNKYYEDHRFYLVKHTNRVWVTFYFGACIASVLQLNFGSWIKPHVQVILEVKSLKNAPCIF